MARIRTLKPEFWTDAKTGTLPEFAKCLLIGLLNYADDYGVLEFDPVGWRAKIFPYHSDTTTGAVWSALVENLLPTGLVILFSMHNDDDEVRRYLFIRHFHRHQVINKPSKPLLEDWKLGDTPKTYASRRGVEYENVNPLELEGSGSPPVALPAGKERKGEERKGEEKKGEERKEGRTRASELAPPWTDADRERFWAEYPNKVGRAAAMKAFDKASHRTTPEVLFPALHRYATKTDDRPFCNPATWLNQERWLDEPVAVARQETEYQRKQRKMTEVLDALDRASGEGSSDQGGSADFSLPLPDRGEG